MEGELRALQRARDGDHQTLALLKLETQELAANRAAMQQEVQRLQSELQRVAAEVRFGVSSRCGCRGSWFSVVAVAVVVVAVVVVGGGVWCCWWMFMCVRACVRGCVFWCGPRLLLLPLLVACVKFVLAGTGLVPVPSLLLPPARWHRC